VSRKFRVKLNQVVDMSQVIFIKSPKWIWICCSSKRPKMMHYWWKT